MKLLPLLLILISCVNTDKESYFYVEGVGLWCKRITHDYTLKDCYYEGLYFNMVKTDREIIKATNIIKVYK